VVGVGETFDPNVSRQQRLPWVEVSAAPGQLARLACGPAERHPVLHVVLLLFSAVTIYFACEWFVNAVEWLGVQLKVGPVAVGTILAAAGTALPESVVTLVAVLFGSAEHGNDIAVGAAMGGPLVVGTVAYGVTGAMLLWRRRTQRRAALVRAALVMATGGTTLDTTLDTAFDTAATPSEPGGEDEDGRLVGVDLARLARDQRWFLAIFIFKVGLGLVAFAFKPWLGLLSFSAYAVYFWREMRGTGEHASADDLEPLKLQPKRAAPTKVAVLIQVAVTLALIFGASQLFVAQLEWAGPALGLPSVVVALLISPVATELPEVMNAIIWVRQGKTQLALANISGAMMIQATVPSGIGILVTPWLFDTPLVLAGIATMASITYLLWLLSRNLLTAARLTCAAGLYVAFAAALVFTL
jgi:cation:H+ antiporter